jgi:hypothetical protein
MIRVLTDGTSLIFIKYCYGDQIKGVEIDRMHGNDEKCMKRFSLDTRREETFLKTQA